MGELVLWRRELSEEWVSMNAMPRLVLFWASDGAIHVERHSSSILRFLERGALYAALCVWESMLYEEAGV